MKNHISRKIILTTLFSSIMLMGLAVLAGAQSNGLAERLENTNPVLRLFVLYGVGFILSLTPCVYPMIGVTLGYFSSQKGYGGKKSVLLAAVYVLGIAITYSIFGTIAGLTGSLFGGILQNKWVVGGISLLLVALALSMFGLYEIRPPAALSDKASARKGIAGALVMGLIFGLVAGPCVAPVIGGLLAFVAKTQSVAIGFSSFFFVALGMGTPLFVLAIFAAQLPAPGIWMTAINKIAGFLLLLVAAYFAKPLLPDVVAAYIYPVIIILAGLYLGFIDKQLQSTNRMKVFFTFLGTLLVLTGMFISLPVKNKDSQSVKEITWVPYSEQKLKDAAELGIPVFLDFYADWCGVCQEYENGAFKDPKFIKAAEGFITMRVDCTDKDDSAITEVLSNWEVIGLPSIFFIDGTGKQVGEKIEGIVSVDELIRRLDEARNK